MYKILTKTEFLGKNIHYLPVCHSTNDVAAQLLAESPIEGTLVITDNQERGRGQRDNSWEAEPGNNITCSVILYPGFLKADRIFDLSIITSLALHDTIEALGVEGIVIKWPNDIFVSGEKIAGILIENNFQRTQIKSSIIGMGINVNQRQFGRLPATSIANVLDREVPLEKVLEGIMVNLEKYYRELQNHKADILRIKYLDHLMWRGEPHSFYDGEYFKGTIVGINNSGLLQVRKAQKVVEYDIKTIRFIS